MLRFFKRRKAIKQFVRILPLALHRRFGEKTFYSLAEVNKAIKAIRGDSAFAVYAHALCCGREDFESYYGSLKLRCTYNGLRREISKKYFQGVIDFNAAAVYRYAKDYGATYLSDGFYESEIAENSGLPGASD